MKITKVHIYIAIGILLFLVALGYYFYRQGKKGITIQALPFDQPTNPSTGATQGAPTNDNQIKVLAGSLYSDMEGFNYGGHDYAPYNEAITLSDTDLVKLYNVFNTLYQVKSGQTLKQWIESENYYYADVPNSLLKRFAKLNLI
jgi:hypothetical protein